MKPTIGRIVHYTMLESLTENVPIDVYPAIISAVNDDGTVGLFVFTTNAWFAIKSASFSEAPTGSDEARGKWNWNFARFNFRNSEPVPETIEPEVAKANVVSDGLATLTSGTVEYDAFGRPITHNE